MDNKEQPQVNQPLPTGQLPVQAPEPVKSSSKTMWYVVGALVVLVVIGGAYMLTRKSNTTMLQQPATTVTQPTTQPKPTLPRSKALGIITNVVTATALDAQGNAVSPTSSFLATTQNIYLVVTLNNAKVGTKVEYVRYLNNKFLDSNSLKIVKLNTANVSFVWTLSKLGAKHLSGIYRVKVYANGVFEKEISYTIF